MSLTIVNLENLGILRLDGAMIAWFSGVVAQCREPQMPSCMHSCISSSLPLLRYSVLYLDKRFGNKRCQKWIAAFYASAHSELQQRQLSNVLKIA